jgi:serine-type D-Ala-D-Ala carboxypeptidase (penicillin-binding protein 5/6)
MRWVVWTLVTLVGLTSPAFGAGHSSAQQERAPRALLLADATSGRVLRERGADEPIVIGSLGHLMIALLLLERVDTGHLAWDTSVPISAMSARVAGARLGLHAGDHVALGELLRALIVAGTPDAALALAETLGDTSADAVKAMNERARALGLVGTEYGSVLGNAPASRLAVDVTTARDTARLAVELLKHRHVLEWAALSGMPFRGGAVLLRNRNQLLGTVPGANGLFVGEAERGDFRLVATARRGTLELISVALGAPDSASSYSASADWLEWGFKNFDRIEIVKAGEPLPIAVRLRGGLERQLFPIAGMGCSLLRRRDQERRFELGFQLPDVLSAPIARDQRIGEIVVREDGQVLAVVPAVSPADFAAADAVLSAAGR